MTPPDEDVPDSVVTERARFLARHELFRRLRPGELEAIAAVVAEQLAPAGTDVLTEDGAPAADLYLVRGGVLELRRGASIVALVSEGEVFGHSSLLTGTAPAFTVRVRQDATLYRVPGELATELLMRPHGVRFVAHSDQDRLVQAAQAMDGVDHGRLREVRTLVRRSPVVCEPDLTVREAARRMAEEGVTAVLVRLRDGLGIVTDRDMRVRAVAAGLSGDEPLTAIMSTPVISVPAAALAPQASIEMMERDINHLAVVEANGEVAGILSSENLMALDALSPFALRSAIASARTEDDVVDAARDLPGLFVDLVDARLGAIALSRVVTALADAITVRALGLVAERHGPPPVPFAWLALGSMGRSELTLASDQDNGVAFADSDDPAAPAYFALMAAETTAVLARCGFELDPHGVTATNPHYRMPQSEWTKAFLHYIAGWENERLIAAAIAFDFRQVAGDLDVVPALRGVMRRVPGQRRFLRGLAELGTDVTSPLHGFRQRLLGPVDLKKSGLLPIQNLARYYAFANGIEATTTSDRLDGLLGLPDTAGQSAPALRDAYMSMSDLRARHHGELIAAGRRPDNAIDTSALPPLDKATLQEAFRVLSAAQKRLPQQIPPF